MKRIFVIAVAISATTVASAARPQPTDAAIVHLINRIAFGPRPGDVDRARAIRAAISEAVPGDVVVIAGKGHEDYQIVGTTKHHFDDREEAAAALAAGS